MHQFKSVSELEVGQSKIGGGFLEAFNDLRTEEVHGGYLLVIVLL